MWENKTNNYRSLKNIYVTPFRMYSFSNFKYQKINDNGMEYFTINPVPDNNIIYAINDNGKFETKKCDVKIKSDRKYLFFFGRNYDPIIGVVGGEWYPLIVTYENDIFINIDKYYIKQLFLKKRNEYEIIFKKKFSNSYSEIKKLNDYKYDDRGDNWEKFINEVYDIMNKYKKLDTIKRIRYYKTDSEVSSFISFAQKIINNTKNVIEGINEYFPNEIKQKIQNIINYLLKNEENDIYYNNIYDLIFNLYNIFINKSKEIEKNKGKINCSKVSQESINKKINELQKEYYLNIKDIKPPENKDNNYFKNLELKILQKINEIDKNKNEIKDLENNNIIISNKLLILGNEVTSSDKIEQNELKKDNENENKVIESTAIEIEEIKIE